MAQLVNRHKIITMNWACPVLTPDNLTFTMVDIMFLQVIGNSNIGPSIFMKQQSWYCIKCQEGETIS